MGQTEPGTTGGHTTKQPGLWCSAAECPETLQSVRAKALASQKVTSPQNIDSYHQDGHKDRAFSFLFPTPNQTALRASNHSLQLGSESNSHMTLGCSHWNCGSGWVINKDSEKAGHYLFLLQHPHSRFSHLLELRFKPSKEQLLLQPYLGQALLSHWWFLRTSWPSPGLQMSPSQCLLPELLLSGLVHLTPLLPQCSKKQSPAENHQL